MSNTDFTKTISARLWSVLQPLGFRKKNVTFTRALDRVIQMIVLQKSTSSTATATKVTVNAGLWVNSLAPLRDGVPDRPDIWSAHWRERVGHLSPEHADLWWEVESEGRASAVGEELAGRILRYVLPEMDRMSTVNALVELWRSGAGPGLTVVQRERYLSKLAGQTPT